MIKVRIVMAPCSSSFASLNLNHSQQASPTGTRTYAECKLLQPGDTPSSLSGLSLAAKSLTSPLWQLMPGWGHSPSTAPVTVTNRWSRDEPTINHQTWIIERLLRAQACKKWHSLPKPEKDLAWKWLIHATENRELFRYVRSQTWDFTSRGLTSRDAVGGWLVY